MRKIIVQTFMTLDGVMQGPGGPDEDRDGGFDQGGWSVNYWDEMMGGVMGAAMSNENDLLLGRRTYDIFAGHWPKADDPFVTPKLNKATKYVVTHHPDTTDWVNTVALSRDPAAEIAALKAGDGSYQPPYLLTSLAHHLVAIDVILSGCAARAFQASQQAVRMAS